MDFLLSSSLIFILSPPPLRDAGFVDEDFFGGGGFEEGLADEGFWKTLSKNMTLNFGKVLTKMTMKWRTIMDFLI